MRARAELTAAAPWVAGASCRLIRLRDAAPVAWRATPDAVYVVGTAATPVGRDEVHLEVSVESGATLRLRSAAATVAWQGEGTTQVVSAGVADRAVLDWQLEPMIATAACHHRQHARIRLEGTGSLRWREEVMLGRHGEAPGRVDLRLDVDLDGRPLLRHQLAFGPGVAGWNGPAVLGGRRCVGLVLHAGAALGEITRISGPAAGSSDHAAWAVSELEGPATLVLAVADDLPALRHALSLGAQSSSGPG